MRYDARLQAYIIPSSEIGKYSIDYLNNFSGRLVIEYPNTKGLSTDFIRQITNTRVGYRIVGGYDKKRIDYWTEKNRANPNTAKGRYGITGLTYYEDANIYNRETMSKIIETMEDIEKDIVPSWSDMKKVLYVYDRLREYIIYHPDYEKQDSTDIRTLRGLISKKTVCAGYALIFKEFMDRQGIECDYVEGATTLQDYNAGKSNHAWNIVKIHGLYFPIDLTWDATAYRQGANNSYGNFSKVERFRRSHYPCKIENLQDYSMLRGIKRSYVKRIVNSFQKKKDFLNSVVNIRTFEGDVVSVVQLEKMPSISERFNPVFRYVVAKRGKDSKYTDYRMVYSETNLLTYLNSLQWDKIKKQDPMIQGLTRLFSYANIDDARKNGSNYIGMIEVDPERKNGFVVKRSKTKRLKYPDKSGEFSDHSGEHFLVSEKSTSSVVESTTVYSGYVGRFVSDRHYQEYRVCSDKSLFDSSVRGHEQGFFGEDYLERRTWHAGGYLGFLSEDGRVRSDKNLANYYDMKKADDIGRSDVVWEDNVYSHDYAASLEFEDVKDVFLKYGVEGGLGTLRVVDRDTSQELADDKMKKIAKFANLWVGAAGSKHMYDEEFSGMNYAFNEGSAASYDYLVRGGIAQLERTGMIDFSKFSSEDMVSKGYIPYKYTDSIIRELFCMGPERQEMFFDFCKLQVEAYVNSDTATKAKSFDNSRKNAELDAMFTPQPSYLPVYGNGSSVKKS